MNNLQTRSQKGDVALIILMIILILMLTHCALFVFHAITSNSEKLQPFCLGYDVCTAIFCKWNKVYTFCKSFQSFAMDSTKIKMLMPFCLSYKFCNHSSNTKTCSLNLIIKSSWHWSSAIPSYINSFWEMSLLRHYQKEKIPSSCY